MAKTPTKIERRETSAPLTDEEIAAATVGERQPLNARIHLDPYNPEWPAMFAKIEGRIRAALGEAALGIEHVGSTSVPGLCAKPIIDMVLIVADSADEAAYVPALERDGFVLRIREPDWFEHRLLKAQGIAGNLHVFSQGCAEVDRMLAFRDWLRTHPEDRDRYAAAKTELAGRIWKHTQNYADAKSDVVSAILDRALGYK